ncbi:MAG: DNA polymerase III subunit delta [Muribaculaceae bacterium]|nr:DNA polymerase III subunit delta [Muribaculaceae bacterium]
MKFADIYGHEDVKDRLRRMADDDHIPHALLLEGPAGAAKFALARAFAQYIHCTNRVGGDSCGVCPSCRQHEAFGHIDTVFSFPVVKRGSGKATVSDDYIEEFRTFMSETPYMDFDTWRVTLDSINAQPQIYVDEANELLRRLTFMTRQSRYKVALLWLPERMREDTANKLLKLVEEPFADTKFVMVSNDARRILPTIYSRTQRVEVRRYTEAELTDILVAHGHDEAAAADVARISEGNINEALKLVSVSKERLQYFEFFVELMRKAYARKVADLRAWSIAVAGLGREGAMQFVDYCTRLVRESFLMHLGDGRLLTLDRTEHAFTVKFFPFINEKNVVDMTALFDDARRDVAANANAKMVFFDLAVRVIILIRRNGN